MISLILILPLISGLAVFFIRNKIINRIVLLGIPLIFSSVAISIWFKIEWYWLPDWLLAYFSFDSIGLFFFSIMTMVFLSISLYSLFYFEEHQLSPVQEAVYIVEILLFVVAMTGVILSTHLALLWVFVEATTLTSALLIYFEKKKSSLEAAWKYVYICSIGIALAFVGIIILSIGSRSFDSLFF